MLTRLVQSSLVHVFLPLSGLFRAHLLLMLSLLPTLFLLFSLSVLQYSSSLALDDNDGTMVLAMMYEREGYNEVLRAAIGMSKVRFGAAFP